MGQDLIASCTICITLLVTLISRTYAATLIPATTCFTVSFQIPNMTTVVRGFLTQTHCVNVHYTLCTTFFCTGILSV